jgi:hypothetical protein
MAAVLWFSAFFLFFTEPRVVTDAYDIKLLLPQAKDILDWIPEDDSQIAVGDDLYMLINGGAQIYLEYGFRQAVYQSYTDRNGNRINLEIYEMTDSAAAYGIYTFKTNTRGEAADLDCEGWMSDYYLNFWKGSLVVTLIGLDTNEKIRSGLKTMARVIEKKIIGQSQRPHIMSYLPAEKLKPNGLTYIRGNLALANRYSFATSNILNCTKGATGRYPDYSLFLLEYPDSLEAQKWFSTSKNFIGGSERYTGFQNTNNTYNAMDKKKNALVFMIYKRWIIIYIGSDMKVAYPHLESIRQNLKY